MKGFSFLAQAASLHREGTFSLLGGGISWAWVPVIPSPFRAVLVSHLQASPKEAGRHKLELRVLGPKNKDVMPATTGDWDSTQNPDLNLVLEVAFDVAEYGAYTFRLAVDGADVSDWNLTFLKTPPPGFPNPGG